MGPIRTFAALVSAKRSGRACEATRICGAGSGGSGRTSIRSGCSFFYARYERLNVGRLDWLSATLFGERAETTDPSGRTSGLTDPIVVDDVGVDAFGYAVQAGAHLGARHAMVFGGEIYDEHVDARRDETNPVTGLTVQKRALYPNGSRYTTTGLFVQDQFDIVRGDEGRGLVARLGGRFTRVDVRTMPLPIDQDAGESLGVVDSERSYQDWTFNAGLTWAVTRW